MPECHFYHWTLYGLRLGPSYFLESRVRNADRDWTGPYHDAKTLPFIVDHHRLFKTLIPAFSGDRVLPHHQMTSLQHREAMALGKCAVETRRSCTSSAGTWRMRRLRVRRVPISRQVCCCMAVFQNGQQAQLTAKTIH